MSRAGSDIGYCDSDYRDTFCSQENYNYTEDDIRTNVEALGFKLNEVQLCESTMELYITDAKTGISYDYYDLEYHIYDVWTRQDFLISYNEKFNKEEL